MKKEDFLDAIAKNPDDISNRLIYADWLEDSGDIDESLRQRQWIPAKQELMSLMEIEETEPELENDNDYYSYEPYMTFQEFIDFLTENRKTDYLSFGNKESLLDCYHHHTDRVWELWSIITGHRSPLEKPYGGCAC